VLSGGREGSRAWSGPVAIVIALTVAGGVLRFATLGVQSIWLDESATMILIHRGFSDMLSHLTASEEAPPLYYILVWGWTRLFGLGVVSFRAFSALAGTLTIPVLYLSGAQISRRAGLWAAALVSVSPSMYYFSQEARAYALFILLAAIAFLCFQRALEQPTGRRLWLWAAMSILATLTHYFAAFLFGAEALVLVWQLGWRRIAPPAAAVIVVGLALAPLASAQSGKASFIEATSVARRVAESVKWFSVGNYGSSILLATALFDLLAVGAVALLVLRGEERERLRARDAAIVGAVALAVPILLGLAKIENIFDSRNVMPVWVTFAIVVAAGIGTARAGRTGAILGLGLCALSVIQIVAVDTIPAYQKDDWRGVASALGRPAPRVIVAEQYGSRPLYIYMGPLEGPSAPQITTSEVDFVGLRKRRTVGSTVAPIVPLTPPHGFTLASVRRTETYAISRFTAPAATTVTAAELRNLSGQQTSDVIIQR